MISAASFNDRYRREGDPWGYRTRQYERDKYAATLAACGPGPFRSALELGASIGVFSALLAPLCERLTTVDFSEVAVREARQALERHDHVEVRTAEIPWGLGDGPHDLIVASEVLYYLAPFALEGTIAWLQRALAAGGRLVIVHWRPAGPERPFTAQQVHDRVVAEPWLLLREQRSRAEYLLHVLERR